MRKRLERLESMLNTPSPRMPLRMPMPPGYSGPNAASADFGSGNRFGPPLPAMAGAFLVVSLVNCLPFHSAQLLLFQLVGHTPLLATLTGKPLDQRHAPASCQPPIRASANRLALAMYRPFLPNGRL